jgi:hypothetical protein
VEVQYWRPAGSDRATACASHTLAPFTLCACQRPGPRPARDLNDVVPLEAAHSWIVCAGGRMFRPETLDAPCGVPAWEPRADFKGRLGQPR